TRVTRVSPGQANARTPKTMAAIPRNSRSHQDLASACSTGRWGRGIDVVGCMTFISLLQPKSGLLAPDGKSVERLASPVLVVHRGLVVHGLRAPYVLR